MATYDNEVETKDDLTPSKMLSRAFWCGFFVHICLTGFIQDWYGLNKYIHVVRDGWMNTHWIMWAVLAFIGGFVYWRLQARVNS